MGTVNLVYFIFNNLYHRLQTSDLHKRVVAVDEFSSMLDSSAGRMKDLNRDMMMVTMRIVMTHLAPVIHGDSDTSENVPSLIDQGG